VNEEPLSVDDLVAEYPDGGQRLQVPRGGLPAHDSRPDVSESRRLIASSTLRLCQATATWSVRRLGARDDADTLLVHEARTPLGRLLHEDQYGQPEDQKYESRSPRVRETR